MNTSSKNVLILRTLIALCKSDRKLPNVFYALGYRQIMIEQPFVLQDGRTVVPDLVISSRKENNSIVWENKSGRNVDNGQAKRLSLIKAEDFRDKLMVDISLGEGFVFDIAYTCDGEHCGSIKVDLDRLSKEIPAIGKFPVVGFDEDYGLRKHSGSFKREAVDKLLADGIQVDVKRIPPQYYPFDKDSTLSEIAPFVVQSIVSRAARQEAQFSAEQVTEESYGNSWKNIASNEARNNMIRKVENILDEARDNELWGYLTRIGRGGMRSLKWQLGYSNRSGGAYPAGRLKTLQKRCREFVNRLRSKEAGIKQLRLPLFLEEDEDS
jgi:hypothetical protein